ncbi:MAG TPA: PHP domain-containing protein [Armatimonadota bacterium]|nr:PHP domain-containing protein [Armatimonadota bacterium]
MRTDMDLHLHTALIGCANETMSVPALLQRCEQEGITTIAITDHLNRPDQLPTHLAIKQQLREYQGPVQITWGVEANVADPATGELTITPEQVEEAGFELVIAGVHASYYTEPDVPGIVDLQHRLMMAVVQSPLVDVLVHPWWFGRGEFESGVMAWMTTLEAWPEAQIRELGQAARETGTAIEMNADAIITNGQYGPAFQEDYKRVFGILLEEGAKFTTGSDAHSINQVGSSKLAAQYLAEIGATDEDLLVPAPTRL